MNKSIFAAVVLSSTALLSGCVGGPANNDVSYDAYEPGYTGYTVGYGAYGIPNGYGPTFWGPGYYNYTGYNTGYYSGYNRGYGRAGYYGGYHGGSAGGYHGGSAGGYHGGFAGGHRR